METVNARPVQINEAISKVPRGMPVVMLNMLRFKAYAEYPDGTSDVSGRQAYAKYSKQAFKHVQKVGGEVVWSGEAQALVIGPADECWDRIFLVRYPSIEKFIEMINSDAYQEIIVHRSSALIDSRLIVTIESNK